MFSQPFGGEHDVLGSRKKAQSGNEELPGDNHNDSPCRNNPQRTEADKSRGRQDLVRQRVHQFSKIRDQVAAARDGAIKIIRESGRRQKHQRCGEVPGKCALHAYDESGRQEKPQHGQLIGKIHNFNGFLPETFCF